MSADPARFFRSRPSSAGLIRAGQRAQPSSAASSARFDHRRTWSRAPCESVETELPYASSSAESATAVRTSGRRPVTRCRTSTSAITLVS
jgi:hypothetical protein